MRWLGSGGKDDRGKAAKERVEKGGLMRWYEI
jgi:hypothetical protein